MTTDPGKSQLPESATPKDELALEAIDRRFKVWLLVVSLLTIALLAAAALHENVLADWKRYRAGYAEVLAEKANDPRGKAAAREFGVHLVQSFVPELGTVDRCRTCHTGVGDPRMRNQPQPFTTHLGRYIELHDPEKFGCTVCHEGQGRATEAADAHGWVPHWDYPMLPKRFVRATCVKCHTEGELFGKGGLIALADGHPAARGDELLARGMHLARQSGCRGCHVLDGKGGSSGPDLTAVGDKTRHEFDFSHFDREAPREVTFWLEQHFLEPSAISPGTVMPRVANQDDASALTAYMLSHRTRAAGRYLHTSAGRGRLETGPELYAQYCSACHGLDGSGSRVPGIRTPALNNPDVLAVAGDDYFRSIIENGRSGTAMPAWGDGRGNLTRDEIDLIVSHIRNWDAAPPALADVSSRTGDPDNGASYYRGLCAGCHGRRGEGGIGNALNSATFLAVADDRFLARSIVYGRPGTAMPGWKHLPAQAVSDILAHVRTWQDHPPSIALVREFILAVPTAENERIGKLLFASKCASCHGGKGEGGIGPSLASQDFLRAVDDIYLYRAIVDGRPSTAMPAWRHLSADDIGALIVFLRSLQVGDALDLRADIRPGDYAVGEVHYRIACAGCHGPTGEGGVGPQLANTVFLESVSDATLFHWIANGRTGSAMKGFRPEAQGPIRLATDQIADVIAYLRHLGTREEPTILRTGVGNPTVGARHFAGSCASCHGPGGEGASGPQLKNPAFLRTASDGFLAATMVLGRTDTAMQSMVHGREGLGQVPPDNVADIIAYMRLWEFPETWLEVRDVSEMSTRSVGSGAEKFARYCAGCHGPTGRGQRDGQEYYAPALNNPEFLDAASDGFLLATIARGRGGTPMRPFGPGAGGIVSLEFDEISDIVAYIRSWQSLHASQTGGKHEEG